MAGGRLRGVLSLRVPSSCQVLPWLLIGGWAALGRDCGELRRRSVTSESQGKDEAAPGRRSGIQTVQLYLYYYIIYAVIHHSMQ